MSKRTIMQELLKKRIEFYANVSKEPEVFMEKFNVYQHPDVAGINFFLYLKYQLQDKNDKLIFTNHEEIESFTDDKGWMCLLNQTQPLQLAKFLKNVNKVSIDTSNVRLK